MRVAHRGGVPAELLAQRHRGRRPSGACARTSPASANSSAFARQASARGRPAPGSGRRRRRAPAATWIAVGKMSLLRLAGVDVVVGVDLDAGPRRPQPAREASTSLVFMLELVPEPVWNTSTGKWSSCRPSATSRAARRDRLGACSRSSTPRSALTRAAGGLDRAPSARDQARLQPGAADREVLHRALGLGPPQGVGGDPDLAHGVVLGAVLLLVAHPSEATRATWSQ